MCQWVLKTEERHEVVVELQYVTKSWVTVTWVMRGAEVRDCVCDSRGGGGELSGSAVIAVVLKSDEREANWARYNVGLERFPTTVM